MINLQNIFITDEEISKLKATGQVSTVKISFPKISMFRVFLTIIIGGFLFNQILIWKMSSSGVLNKPFSININIARKK